MTPHPLADMLESLFIVSVCWQRSLIPSVGELTGLSDAVLNLSQVLSHGIGNSQLIDVNRD